MSQNRRPSPIQPPVVTHSRENMVQVQRRPDFPLPNVFNRPQSTLTHGSPLPSISAFQQDRQPGNDQLRLPPIQLPPISGQRPPPSVDVFSITSLLSRNAESPKEYGDPPRSIQQQRHQQPAQSFPSSVPESYSDVRSHPPTAFAEQRRYTEDASYLYRSSPSFIPPQRHYSHQLQQSPNHFDVESPATSTYAHSRGTYSNSTQSSPNTTAAPQLSSPHQPRVSEPPPFNFNLSIRQQPAAARACGFGERDRRVIDPPPILELRITDKDTGAPEQDVNGMLFLHCTLLSEDGKEDETEVPPTGEGMPTTRRLMGTLVASPYQAKDERGIAGTFFVFPDLSCRSPGHYRLRFKLLRVDPAMMVPGARHLSVASIVSDIFSVFTAKDFPGMRASSTLLKALRRQGLNVGVKKGSEARKGRSMTKKESSSDDEDDDHSEEENNEGRRGSVASAETESNADISPRSKPKKKGKRRKREERHLLP